MDDRLSQIRARKKLDDRLREHQWCVDQFIAVNSRYLLWMPRSELECLLLNALWDPLKKWDENPEETRDFYLVLWYQARHELSRFWRQVANQKGRTRSNLYNPDFNDNEHLHDAVEGVFVKQNPMYIAMMLERLERLPPKHQEILECLAGAGHKAYAVIAEELGLISQHAVIVKISRIRDTLENDGIPNAVGIEKQVIDRLGLGKTRRGIHGRVRYW